MNTEQKLKELLTELDKYEDNTFAAVIQERLDKVLDLYLKDLSIAYSNLLAKKDSKKLLKGLCNENKFK